MLDPSGFVSSCNATNFFFVRNGRGRHFHVASTASTASRARTSSHCAASTAYRSSCATSRWRRCTAPTRPSSPAPLAASRPVREIDGHVLPAALPGPVTQRLRELYAALQDAEAARVGS